MELTASDVCAVSGAVSAVSLPMDSGNGYRGNFHFQDVSGFAVSAVSAVILPDINEMELTASDISPVSGAVSTVSLNEKEAQSSEVPVEYIHSMPEEVQGWSDFLQEDFCIHVEWNREEGMSWEEADRLAIEHVKSTPDYLTRGPHVY